MFKPIERRAQERRELIADFLHTERRKRIRRQEIQNARVLDFCERFYNAAQSNEELSALRARGNFQYRIV